MAGERVVEIIRGLSDEELQRRIQDTIQRIAQDAHDLDRLYAEKNLRTDRAKAHADRAKAKRVEAATKYGPQAATRWLYDGREYVRGADGTVKEVSI